MPATDSVQFNKTAHDRISRVYERRHTEIFNPVEQDRLRKCLKAAVDNLKTGSEQPRALDVGCGSGNLTRHVIELGLRTTSADLSERFLELIRKKFAGTGMSDTLKLNGRDLSNVRSETYDFVAAYSVLHHIPDYMKMVDEMCRVAKPGGIVYIDHEVNESYWKRPAEYVEFLRAARPRVNIKRYIRLMIDVPGYIHIVRRLLNPRYKREGDIHVWPDDHVEWDRIEDALAKKGFEIVLKEDYLLYRSVYDRQVFENYKDKCTDQRILAARKAPAQQPA